MFYKILKQQHAIIAHVFINCKYSEYMVQVGTTAEQFGPRKNPHNFSF